MTTDLKGKRVLVFGLKRTGVGVVEAAAALGADVFAYDDNIDPGAGEVKTMGGTALAGVPVLTLEEASARDFDICVVSPAVPPANKLVQLFISRDIPVISEIEFAYKVAKAPIAAVTGTNGKSTTTVLAGKMLEASGWKTWIGGNLSAEGYDLPLIKVAMSAEPEDVISAEVSSFQLERCFEFHPRAAALLNVTEEHLNRHTSFEEYAAAKMRVFQAQNEEDFAILGADDPLVASLGRSVRARKLWFSGKNEVSEGAFLCGDSFILKVDGQKNSFAESNELKLWTFYDHLNVLAAALVAWAMGASLEGIRAAALNFAGLSDRMEDCGILDGVRWINSSMCTNPAAGRAAVTALTERYPTILIAGGADKNCDLTQWGRDVAKSVKLLLLIGRDAKLMDDAARKAGMSRIREFQSLQEAMEEARRVAVKGDVVALAPAMASFGLFQDFAERGRVFRGIVKSFRMEAGL